jgi:hypothetical protein
MSLLDRAAGAGAITSRIDHQDAAATLIALTLLAREQIFGLAITDPEGTILHCEGRDDLELVTPHVRCLVSVKAQPGEMALLIKEYSRLSERCFADPSRMNAVALLMVGPQPAQTTNFVSQLDEARSLIQFRDADEAGEVRAEFVRRWPRASPSMLSDYYVMLGVPRLHSNEYLAVAIKLLRKIAPLTDYTDERAMVLLSDLTGKFSRARLARGSVTLTEIRDAMFSFALPLDAITLVHEYVKTTYGYLRHPQIAELLRDEMRDVRAAYKFAMRRYRAANFKRIAAAALFLGPVKCISCNGPLMANFFGLTKRGIACSRCGFLPFMSIFYACPCGKPILLVAQPSLDLVDFAIAIRYSVETLSCDSCHQKPRFERLYSRIFQLNIPWPPEIFSDKVLIESRKSFGWNSRGFRGENGGNARTALLSEALVDRVGRRFSSDESDKKAQ